MVPCLCACAFGNSYSLLYNKSFHRCIRFTMHQQRRSHCRDLEYNRLMKERPKSCVKRESALSNLPQVPAHTGLAQVLPSRSVARPQSGIVKPSTQHQTSRPQLRAKSAHPRLLEPPKYMHTNASTQQLQVCYEKSYSKPIQLQQEFIFYHTQYN